MGPWILVIREGHVWPYEHVVLDGDARRNEDKGADFAVISDSHSFFNVNVGIDFCVLSDLTPIEVD